MLQRLQPEGLMEQVSQKVASYLLNGERMLKSLFAVAFFLNFLIEALLKKIFLSWGSVTLRFYCRQTFRSQGTQQLCGGG